MRASVAVVGAGPRGTGFLERLAANAPSLYGNRPLDIHLIDPYPPGGGRIWREDQSPLLWMNSMAADVTMFTDASAQPLEGPVRPGPDFAEWSGADPRSFPTRQAQSGYLRWVYEEAVAALPPGSAVRRHRTRATRISGPADGRQQVWLEGEAEPVIADLVVLTIGHLDADPDGEQRELARFARRYGLVHLPPAFTADSDLSVLGAGEPVVVRGFGLAFIDLMVLLTEGRGGRYDARGEYLPSGREPVLYVGSRRGVPYHAKIGYTWAGERPPLPRFFGPEQVDELLAGPGPVDFDRHIRPLIDRELGFAHYHRLFTAHPGRTTVDWPVFEEKYAAAAAAPELAALTEDAVPDPADRFDPEALDRPLDGVRHDSFDALQESLRYRIEADITRRHDPAYSPDLAVFLGLLSVYGQLTRLGDTGEGGTRWHGFFSFLASGPPGPRLRQLLALSRAGVVRFLGAGITVTADESRGVFSAGSASVPGERVEARALVEARLPAPSPARTRSALLNALYEDGARSSAAGLLVVDPADGRVVERGTGPHPRRFALGPHTTARSAGAFARPHTNAPAFRQNDATARAALTLLKESAR
ncbi:FAD/NAD(P)-binding protein [Streptomyces sp. NBC_01180]|uniref:FAD/NAD(P)-binding protein n=1 Tax=Streptomyces sp. NBC_01180 TaxID=2903763 RepID=UPI00386FC83B|nr:FAD/NAD(P)-binding protein [Streptomyces sp. NBC_01180]